MALRPGRVLAAVLAVGVVALVLSGLIGQHNDGPLGGLPEWLGAASWFTALGAALVLVVGLVALGVARLVRTVGSAR